MARTATLTFDDGSQHVYNGVPDDATPDVVIARASKDFPAKKLKSVDGGRSGPSPDEVATLKDEGNLHTLIPGAPPRSEEPPPRQPSAIAGIPGALTTMARGIPGMLAGGATAAVRELASKALGADPQQARLEGQEAGSAVSAPIVGEPSAQAQSALGVVEKLFNESKLAGVNPAGPVAGAGNAANIARYAGAKAVTGANAVADALEATRATKRAALPPEALAEADVVRRAQAQGYKALPVQTNPSVINHVLESVGGKVKTEQNISLKNQPVTNRLSKEGAGVAATDAATPDELAAIRKDQGVHYDAARSAGVIPLDEPYLAETGSLSSRSKNAAQSFPGLAKDDTATLVEGLQNPALEANGAKAIDASHAIDMIGILREQADSLWSSNKTLAKANRKAADALEGLIERHISDPANGFDPALVENFRNARTKIAKTYDVESAVNPATSNVSARALARRDKGGKKLTGELKDVADFARTQEKAVQRPEVIGGVPAGSVFDAALTSLLHGAKGVASLGIRPAARAISASDPYQRLFVQPKDYANPGLVERLARSVAGEKEMPPQIRPDPNAIQFTGADIPSMVAERLRLGERPGPMGNEIDFGARERALAPASRVEEAEAAHGARQADAARAVPFERASVPSAIAERLQLAESPPKKFGNEIDPAEFLRSLRIGRGEAIDEAVVDRAMQAEATKRRFPPASVMNDFQWLMKDK